ncbi:RDD family protein [Neisseria dumasiana]|uniref:RDD domain-containing protein n=1 Tax=Neisseria dumasiana TaxID=1931275 RepID=A0A1X3DIQ7_9NEIS|nr:RDD family protein [Neisseria dumasiana]OSI21656.1 hypothetical protein BV912_06280 [Neisseria dumasiana]
MYENHQQNLPLSSEEVIDVEIATPKSRIVAYLLNTLFTVLAFVPIFLAFIMLSVSANTEMTAEENFAYLVGTTDWGNIWIGVGLLILLGYTVVQCWMLSRHGQSIGKKIMKIRLLKNDGTNPGFWYAVMVREVGFNVVLTLAVMVVAYLLVFMAGKDGFTADYIANSLSTVVWLVCLSMLFNPAKNRRTLQDYFANTVVVRVPERHGK